MWVRVISLGDYTKNREIKTDKIIKFIYFSMSYIKNGQNKTSCVLDTSNKYNCVFSRQINTTNHRKLPNKCSIE